MKIKNKFYIALLLALTLVVIGILGYIFIGHYSFIDAL